jgi:hypothetical protein
MTVPGLSLSSSDLARRNHVNPENLVNPVKRPLQKVSFTGFTRFSGLT